MVTWLRVNPTSRVFHPPSTNKPKPMVVWTVFSGIPQCKLTPAAVIVMGLTVKRLLVIPRPAMMPLFVVICAARPVVSMKLGLRIVNSMVKAVADSEGIYSKTWLF